MSHFFHHMSRSRNDLHTDPNPETPLVEPGDDPTSDTTGETSYFDLSI